MQQEVTQAIIWAKERKGVVKMGLRHFTTLKAPSQFAEAPDRAAPDIQEATQLAQTMPQESTRAVT